MADVSKILIAQGAAAAARPLLSLSKTPTVVNYPTHVEIVLDQVLQEETAAFIIRQLDAEPGAVRVVGLGGVLTRVIARKYFGWLAAGLVGAFAGGRLTAGGKK